MFHPHHGHGTVTGHEGSHAVVKFDAGGEHRFEVTPGGKPATLQPRGTDRPVTGYATKGASDVGRLLGGGHSAFNGTVKIFGGVGNEGEMASMGWDGTMNVRDGVAAALENAAANPDAVIPEPRVFPIILHELIHSTVPDGQTYASHSRAYQDKNTAMIEEGFTELGTIQHMPEFADAIGIGQTPVTAFDTSARHATMSGYAKQMQSPERIAARSSWGTYGQQTAAAQEWTRMVALQEAGGAADSAVQARMRQLADQVNREGPGGKALAMAKQVMSAEGVPDREIAGGLGTVADSVALTIKNNWEIGDSGPAFRAAVEAAQAFAPPPPRSW